MMTAARQTGVEARLQLAYPGFSLDVALVLPGRSVIALSGPSGCGKTTCLRAIAGLIRVPGGHVAVNGELWQDDDSGQPGRGVFVPTHRRALGYVFQETRLFPHLDVRRNIAFGMQRVDVAARRVSLDQAVELLGLAPLLARRPETLSGGERQRVGIARALATSPRLLLMDEPLAALDLQRKAEIVPYLERLHGELDIPVIYVTHAPEEVARLADHLVQMADGRVLASGPVAQVLTRLDLPSARGDAAAAVVAATVVAHEPRYGLAQVGFDSETLWLPDDGSAVGRVVRVRIQARDVSLTLDRPSRTSVLNILQVTVAELVDDGPAQTMVVLTVGRARLLARITRKSRDALALLPGSQVYAQIKGVALLD